jgi:hypothetical protein
MSPVSALILLGVIFLIPGFICYDDWVKPFELRSWIATPCTIVSSVVPAGRKQPAANAITYSYNVQGRQYQSTRYYFHAGPSAKTVRAHPPGQQTTCYVNPTAPQEAFLVSTLPEEISYLWFVLLFPISGLCFLLGGLCSVVFSLVKRGRPASVADVNGPTILEPHPSPLQAIALYAAIFLPLDALVSGLWYFGGLDAFAFFILIPFSTLCILGTFFLGRRIVGLFNPRPTLDLTPRDIPLGGAARLRWQFTGGTKNLRWLQISLSGVEQTIHPAQRYSRYGNVYTRSRVFHQSRLFHGRAPDPMSAGERQFVFPSNTMHSFESAHNSITWTIDVRAAVAWLPRIKTQFLLTVTPHEQALAGNEGPNPVL